MEKDEEYKQGKQLFDMKNNYANQHPRNNNYNQKYSRGGPKYHKKSGADRGGYGGGYNEYGRWGGKYHKFEQEIDDDYKRDDIYAEVPIMANRGASDSMVDYQGNLRGNVYKPNKPHVPAKQEKDSLEIMLDTNIEKTNTKKLYTMFKKVEKGFTQCLDSKGRNFFEGDQRYLNWKRILWEIFTALSLKDYNLIVEKRIEKRLWKIINQELTKAEEQLKRTEEEGKEIDRSGYQKLCDDSLGKLKQLFGALYKENHPLTTPLIPSNTLRKLCGHLCLYMGDITRYKAKQSKLLTVQDSIEFYTRTKFLYPFDGKVFNQMAILSAKSNDYFATIFWYLRALSSSQPFLPARESLVIHFEKATVKAKQQNELYKPTHNWSRKGEQNYLFFVFSFLRLQGILFTRIGLDQFEEKLLLMLEQMKDYLCYIVEQDKKYIDEHVNKIIYVLMIAMFSLHYSIHELEFSQICQNPRSREAEEVKEDEDPRIEISKTRVNEEQKEKPTISPASSSSSAIGQALEGDIGSLGVKQYTQMLLLLMPYYTNTKESIWLSSLLPSLYWFYSQPLISQKILKQSPLLSRSLHNLSISWKPVIDTWGEQLIEQCYQQLSNYLPEDSAWVGFLPIQLYLDEHKNIYGEKVGLGFEEKVRIMQLLKMVDIIGDLGLGGKEFKEFDFREIDDMNADSSMKIMEPEILNSKGKKIGPEKGKLDLTDFAKLPNAPQFAKALAGEKPLVILDVQNIAMRHGNKIFSCKGIQIVMDYWLQNGHKVISFLPDYLLDYDKVGEMKRLKKMNYADAKNSKIPDSVTLLKELQAKGLLVGTPAQDYDDSYCIQYAKLKDGYMITNDRFWDYIDKQSKENKRREKEWIRAHTISYTFNKDEFLPNPDSSFFTLYDYASYKS